MSEIGKRFNEGKPKWSLVPQSALLPMVRVLEFGQKKYGAWNWTRGLKTTEICESSKRHLDAYMEGEDIDPESKLSHIGHLQCNTMFLSWMMEHKPELDDRHFKKEENMFTGNTKHPSDLYQDIGFTAAIIWDNCSGLLKSSFPNEGSISHKQKTSQLAVKFVHITQEVKDWEKVYEAGAFYIKDGNNIKTILKCSDLEDLIINFVEFTLKEEDGTNS